MLNTTELATVERTVALLRRHPEEVMHLLARHGVDNKVILAMAMQALVNSTKEHLEVLRMTTAVGKFIGVSKEEVDGR